MLLPFALPTDFVRVFRTCRGDVASVFIDTPIEFTDTPTGLSVLFLVDHTVHAELDEEGTDGVDDLGMDNVDGEVCGGKDTDGLFFWGRLEGTLHLKRVLIVDCIPKGCDCFDFEGVVDVGERAMGRCREVAREEVGEGEAMCAVRVGGGLGDEVPVLEDTDPIYAIRAILGYGSLGHGVRFAVHANRRQAYVGIGHYDFELAREEGAGRIGSTVEDAGRRLHLDVDRDPGLRSSYLGASLGFGRRLTATNTMVFVLGTEVKEIHGCCVLALIASFKNCGVVGGV